MDKNYDELYAALKSHSERNAHFIAELEKLKSISYRERIGNFFSRKTSKSAYQQLEASPNQDYPKTDQTKDSKIIQSHSERNAHFIVELEKLKSKSCRERIGNFFSRKTSKSAYQQLEASPNQDYPKTDQTKEEDTVSEIIQDIIMRMHILEDETKYVVEKFLQYPSTVSKEGEEKSSVTHFQVYERDMHTEDFVTALKKVKNELTERCIPDVIEKVSDIDINKPLIILCQSGSRLVPDITYSLEHFEDLHSFTRLAIVVIHNKERHALPTTSSQSKLSEDVRFKNMLIIDAAFTNALQFYDCKMNNEAIVTIETFLKSDTPI